MVHVLCFGDSNTHGMRTPVEDGAPAGRYPWEERWTGRLQKALGESVRIIEEGHNGRTSVWYDPVWNVMSGIDYLLPCLASHRPLDLVVFMLGTNDTKDAFGASIYSIQMAMERCLRLILQEENGNGCPPTVLLCAPPPLTEPKRADWRNVTKERIAFTHKLGGAYEALADKLGIDFLDLAGKVELDIDGTHFTGKGHAQAALVFEEKLREILKL